MKLPLKIAFIPWRFYFLIILLLLAVGGLIIRLIVLTVFEQHFLQNQGDARALRMVTEPAFRGMMTDRDGNPLAISTTVYSVWFNPKEFPDQLQSIKKLSRLLELKSADVMRLAERYKKTSREFVYLKRDISPDLAKQIKILHVPGIYLETGYKRYYPEGEIAAHVVGFTNVDDHGQEGLELAFDAWLAGTPGKKQVLRDRLGHVIENVQSIQEKKPGNDLVLSLQQRIQYLAYRELMTGVQENAAESGSIVVLDVQTGEILAMANLPSFNPNNRTTRDKEKIRNRAVTDLFEPGSTIKAFSIASALDSGLFRPHSVIDTAPGWLRVGPNLVLHDEHNNGPLTISQILQLSSNVGTTKMILSLPPNQIWSVLHRVGFGEITGVGFPGERSGNLVARTTWSPTVVATLGFGYGLSVTTLQLAQAYSVLANHGVKIPLSLVRVDAPPVGKRVMDAKVADEMLALLESVVAKGGTGEKAAIPDYRVAGKTGTAWIAVPNGYDHHRFVSSFVGIAPASHPRFVVAVVIHDPKGKDHLGGYVAGPVFRKVMEGTLHNLNVPPDKFNDPILLGRP